MKNWRIIIFFVLLLFAFSCRQNDDEINYKVFRYNESAGISSLDPAFARDQANIWAATQLFCGLVQLDDKLNILPCIARSWEIKDSGRTYCFKLRNDIYFHDSEVFKEGKGRRVLASDFVYSFNRIRDPRTASPGAWVFASVRNDSLAFSAIDDTTLVIRLSHAFPPFLGILTMPYCAVVPREAVEKYGKDFRSHPVGCGPFMFKYWKEGVKLVLVKNPNYFETENGNRLPYLDAVAITFIVDKQTAFFEFVKGNLDFLSGLDPGYKDELLLPDGRLNPKYENTINLITQPYLNTEYLGFLCDKPQNSVLRNKLVRQAINVGFDRAKMLRYMRNNIGTPGNSGIVPPCMPGFLEDSLKSIYNPEHSAKLLAEAGYPQGKGLPEITLTTTASYLDLCNFIQHELQELNIRIKIDVVPPASLREMVAQGKIDFFRASWIADYPDAENYLSLFYSKNKAPAGPNYTHFSDNTFDFLYEKASSEMNDSLRFVLYRKMNEIIKNETPAIVLYYDQVMRFTRKNISGLGSNPMNLLVLKRVRKE